MKFEDLWHHISQYIVYIAGAFIALFVDVIVATMTTLFHLPSAAIINVQKFLTEGSSPIMEKEEFLLRAIDGHLFLWEISVTELLQIAVLGITFIITAVKGIIDLRRAWKEHRQEKNYIRFKRKIGNKERD